MEFESFPYSIHRHFDLNNDQVHIWYINLNESHLINKQFEKILAEDERERARRFHRDQERNRFILARGMLRVILSSYANTPPQEVRFCYGGNGKPALETQAGEVQFNLTHSDNLALIAVARNRQVGIDVEVVRNDFEITGLIQRYFSEAERAFIGSAPNHKKHQAFFSCWVTKEAYLKARGWGISVPLTKIAFADMVEESPQQFLVSEGKVEWWAHRFIPVPDYVAALVTEGSISHISYRQWAEIEI